MGFKEEATAIVAWLGNETWSEPLNEVRRNAVFWNSDSTDQLTTYVVPLTSTPQPGTRRQQSRTRVYGIFLLQTLNVEDEAAELARQDELIKLIEDIEERYSLLNTLVNNLPTFLAEDEPRISLDSEAAASHIFLAGLRVQVLDLR